MILFLFKFILIVDERYQIGLLIVISLLKEEKWSMLSCETFSILIVYCIDQQKVIWATTNQLYVIFHNKTIGW